MRTLLDAATRERLGANARRAVLPLSPAAITLQLVLLYRDLLAATVQAKAAVRGRTPPAGVDAPSTTRSAETKRPAPVGTDAETPEQATGGSDVTAAIPGAASPPESGVPKPADTPARSAAPAAARDDTSSA